MKTRIIICALISTYMLVTFTSTSALPLPYDEGLQKVPQVKSIIQLASGGGSSAAIDSKGNVHVVFGVGSLIYYMNNAGISPMRVSPKDHNAIRPKIGVNQTGSAHIIYETWPKGENPSHLYYTSNVDGSFSTPQAIGSSDESFCQGNIAVDDNNKAHIIYLDRPKVGRLYINNTSGAFSKTVEVSPLSMPFFALIGYITNNDKFLTPTRNIQGRIPDTFSSEAFAIDSQGNVHIVTLGREKQNGFYYANTLGNDDVTFNSATWVSTDDINIYIQPLIALDSDDNVYISFTGIKGTERVDSKAEVYYTDNLSGEFFPPSQITKNSDRDYATFLGFNPKGFPCLVFENLNRQGSKRVTNIYYAEIEYKAPSIPPTPPTDLKAVLNRTSGEVELSWTPIESENISYNVYRSINANEGRFDEYNLPKLVPIISRIKTPRALDTLPAYDVYYYAVTSVIPDGTESLASDSISVKFTSQIDIVIKEEKVSNLTIAINIDATSDVHAFQFDLEFNPEVLHGVKATNGGFLDSDGKTIFWIPPKIDNEKGRITGISAARIGTTKGILGTGTLAYVTFKIRNPGISKLSLLNAVLSGSSGTRLQFVAESTSVTIERTPQAKIELSARWAGTIIVDVKVENIANLHRFDFELVFNGATHYWHKEFKYSPCNYLNVFSCGHPGGAFPFYVVNFFQNDVKTLDITGDFLQKDGENTIWEIGEVTTQSLPYPSNVKIVQQVGEQVMSISSRRTTNTGASGSGTLATIIFGVWSSRSFDFQLSNIKLMNPEGDFIFFSPPQPVSVTVEAILPEWDINKDCEVDISDLVSVAVNFGKKTCTEISEYIRPNPDVNRNGIVEVLDLSLVGIHFGEQYKNVAGAPAVTKTRKLPHLTNREQAVLLKRMYQEIAHEPNTDEVVVTRELLETLIFTLEKEFPEETQIVANYPNPFNPDTWIPYQLKDEAIVTINIYNVAGELVKTLNFGRKQAGYYLTKDKAAYWDGRNNIGEHVASGIYFYSLQAGDFIATRRMLIVK